MAIPTPEQVAANWQAKLAGSTQRMQTGVEAVTVAPGAAAAKAAPVWAQNVAAAQQKYAKNVGAVSLGSWQQAFITKGIPRIASGAQAGAPKVQAFMTAFLPVVQNAVNSLPARGTFDQNVARATAMMNALHKFSYTPSGS